MQDIAIRAVDCMAITPSQIPDVLDQWIQTAHTAFRERTAWSLFSAFTEVHKLVLKEKPFCPRGHFFSLWINELFSPPQCTSVVHRSASSQRISYNELWKHGPALSKPTRTNSANMVHRRLPFTPSANPSTLLSEIFFKNSHPSKAWRVLSGALGFPA